jgi:hypothetical protein
LSQFPGGFFVDPARVTSTAPGFGLLLWQVIFYFFDFFFDFGVEPGNTSLVLRHGVDL